MQDWRDFHDAPDRDSLQAPDRDPLWTKPPRPAAILEIRLA
jgi:hypothetical protein